MTPDPGEDTGEACGAEPSRGPAARSAVGLASVLAVAAALRLPALGLNSFSLDELFSVRMLLEPPREQLAIYWGDVHPPLFNALAWAWSQLAGTGEAGLRLLPALLGIAGSGALYAVVRRSFGPRAGLAAGLLAATAPGHVYHSQDLRSYAQGFLLCAALLGAALQLARSEGRRGGAALALLGGLLFGTHYAGLFPVAACHVGLFLALPGHLAQRLRRALRLALATGLAMAPFLPHFLFLRATMPGYHPAPPTAAGFAELLAYPFRPGAPGALDAPLALAVWLLALWGAMEGLRGPPARRRSAVLLACAAALPPLGITGVSLLQPHTSIFLLRLSLLFAPALLALAGVGCAELGQRLTRPGRRRALATLPLAVVAGLGVSQLLEADSYRRPVKNDCRGVVRAVAADVAARPAQPLYLGPRVMAWRLEVYFLRYRLDDVRTLPSRVRRMPAEGLLGPLEAELGGREIVAFSCGLRADPIARLLDERLETRATLRDEPGAWARRYRVPAGASHNGAGLPRGKGQDPDAAGAGPRNPVPPGGERAGRERSLHSAAAATSVQQATARPGL